MSEVDDSGSSVGESADKPQEATQQQQQQQKPREYNPRWKGYVYMALTSLVNFASISNVAAANRRRGWTAVSMSFGIFTFVLPILVLIQDRSQKCLEPFHFTKAANGRVEGYTLLFCVLWWMGGVGFITRVNGIGYVANNIYFTAWLCLCSSIYTLNKWSADKDILSIGELTGVSATLKSWYLLFLSSVVALGTCVDLHLHLDQESREDASFGVALGTLSTIVALFFILVHYDFITSCQEGGWLELSSSFFLIMLWIIALAIFTRDEGIAATLSGSKCGRDDRRGDHISFFDDPSCSIVVLREVLSETSATGEGDGTVAYVQETLACSELPRQVPGSNLYFAAWVSFAASLNITFRWKAAQAIQFAQAHHQRQQQKSAQQLRGEEDDEVGDKDSDSNSEADEDDEDAI